MSPSRPRTATENARPSAISGRRADGSPRGRGDGPERTRLRRCEPPPPCALTGKPQTGQSANPAHLGRGHHLGQSAESVTGAGLDLDEHHGGCPRPRSRQVRRTGSASCAAGRASRARASCSPSAPSSVRVSRSDEVAGHPAAWPPTQTTAARAWRQAKLSPTVICCTGVIRAAAAPASPPLRC